MHFHSISIQYLAPRQWNVGCKSVHNTLMPLPFTLIPLPDFLLLPPNVIEQIREYYTTYPSTQTNRILGFKYYTISDHLSNVRAVVTDKKFFNRVSNTFTADIVSEHAYWPFGMPLERPELVKPEEGEEYRYGFNGQEKDDEIKGSGNHLSFGDYGYDTRLGRRWQIAPMTPKYPHLSPYATFNNSPIVVYDPDGYEGIVVSGQPGNHGNNQHFLANGLAKAQAAQRRTKREGEKVTWMIYNDGSKEHGHDPQMLSKYKQKAADLGITVIEFSSSDEIVDYVNEKNGNNDSRANDKITSFYYVGHATPGDLEVGGATSLFGAYIDVDEFESEAFQSGAWINVVGGCQTSVDGLF